MGEQTSDPKPTVSWILLRPQVVGFSDQNAILNRLRVQEKLKQSPKVLKQSLFPPVNKL
jgi:hypothetical protein